MNEKIVAYITLATGILFLLNVIACRIFGLRRPFKYLYGGEASLIGEFAIGFFILFCGFLLLHGKAIWVPFIILAFGVGFTDQLRASRREKARKAEARSEADSKYSSVFQDKPPTDLFEVEDEYISVFDLDESNYLGEIHRSDLKKIIEYHSHVSETRKNDIYLLEEEITLNDDLSLTPETLDVLDHGFTGVGSITLRWTRNLMNSQQPPATPSATRTR